MGFVLEARGDRRALCDTTRAAVLRRTGTRTATSRPIHAYEEYMAKKKGASFRKGVRTYQ